MKRPSPEHDGAAPAVPEATTADRVESVASVATAVVDAVRALQTAHERHVEAAEVATARRLEVITAQAELDAHLIRLHARQEAHDIVAAAARDGDAAPLDPDEPARLQAMSEHLTALARSIEPLVGPTPHD
ncbi:hypothetical protein [Nocardioides dongxiaopingii]|uniref:hypothetical protein n=1 Tax=Nocardioides dongxiaopingii TaxID=2576036 RepID=UPI0010C761C6|nr:hypothetical protein [Nocardioides dongxiaopingii]